MVERARLANPASSAKVGWPLVAHSTTCIRSLSRGSVAARICSLSCAAGVALIASWVRFLAMPKKAPSPKTLDQLFIPVIIANWYKSRRLPLLKPKVCVGQHRRNGNQEQIRTVAANDNRRANLAAGQIREGNRQQDDIISGAVH